MFIWEDRKYDFNIMDADMLEKFNEASKDMWASLAEYEANNTENGVLQAKDIKAECEIIDTFFNALFGKSKAKEIFGTKYDLSSRTKALKKLYGIRKTQETEHATRVAELSKLVFKPEE